MSILTDGTGFGAAVNFLWMVMLGMELLCNIIGAGHVQIHKAHTRFFNSFQLVQLRKMAFVLVVIIGAGHVQNHKTHTRFFSIGPAELNFKSNGELGTAF